MKDLIELILRSLAGYLPILVSVITAPKRSIVTLIAAETDRLNNALLFVGITIALGFALQAPLIQKGEDFVTITGSMFVFKILVILSFSGVILGAFRVVGGKATYETTLCAYLYVISPLYLFVIILRVISIGIVATHDPELARSWLYGQQFTGEKINELIKETPVAMISATAISLLQLPSLVIWFAICWGSFRSIHQVSIIRSTFAYLIVIILWFAFYIIGVFLLKGLHDGAIPSIQ